MLLPLVPVIAIKLALTDSSNNKSISEVIGILCELAILTISCDNGTPGLSRILSRFFHLVSCKSTKSSAPYFALNIYLLLASWS